MEDCETGLLAATGCRAKRKGQKLQMVRLTLSFMGPLSRLILFIDFFNMFRSRRCPAPRAVVGCSRALRRQAAVKRHEDVP